MKNISTFKGKSINDMSREQLIEALNVAVNITESERKENSRQREFIFSMKNAQRGVNYSAFGVGLLGFFAGFGVCWFVFV